MLRSLLLSAALLLTVLTTSAQPVPPDVVWAQSVSGYTVAISPDGQYVAAGGSTVPNPFTYATLDLLSGADGTLLQSGGGFGSGFGSTNEIEFSPDGQTLAAAHGGVYCYSNGGCTPSGPAVATRSIPAFAVRERFLDLDGAAGLGYAPDGATLVVGNFYDNNGAVRVHDAITLDPMLTLSGHRYTATDVDYAPDGETFSSVGDDGFLRVWDAATGDQAYAVEHGASYRNEPFSVEHSPDGSLIAVGGDEYEISVKVYEAATGIVVYEFDIPDVQGWYGFTNVNFSPNGRYLAASSAFNAGTVHHLRFWDLSTGELTLEIEDSCRIASVAFSPALNDRFVYGCSSSGRAVKMVRVPFALVEAEGPMLMRATPTTTPTVVGPNGGAFDFDVTLTNISSEAQTVEVWSSVAGPVERDLLLGPARATLAAGATIERTVTQQVPGAAPDGAYSYTVHVGTFGEAVMASEAFAVVKQGSAAISTQSGLPTDGWDATGFDLSTEVLAAATTTTLPEGYTLGGAGPNPFRTATALSLTVAEAQAVRAEVYDALGRRVAVLHEGTVGAGEEVRLALDGAGLSPGVYIVRVAGEMFTAKQYVTRIR